jgi:hypothetical protein
MSSQLDDDFIASMVRMAGSNFTIKTMGFSKTMGSSYDPMQSISLSIEDARDLAKWILEHTEK